MSTFIHDAYELIWRGAWYTVKNPERDPHDDPALIYIIGIAMALILACALAFCSIVIPIWAMIQKDLFNRTQVLK